LNKLQFKHESLPDYVAPRPHKVVILD